MERQTRFAALFVCIAGCAPAEKPHPPAVPVQPTVVAPVPNEVADSTARVPHDTIAASPATFAAADDTTPLQKLPARFIPDVPGWLGLGIGYMFPDTVGADPDAPAINGGLGVFPYDTVWKHVGRRTPLVLVGDSGRATVFPEGFIGHPWHAGNETMVKVRPETAIPVFWIVPESEAKDVEVLPIVDSLSRDKLTRVWSAGGARIRLHRVKRLSAEMVAEFKGHSVARQHRIGINPSADSAMGVGDETDSILDLKEGWMVPSVYAALRFAPHGTIVMLFSESGYECENVRAAVFRSSGIEWIEEPHFYGNCPS